MGKGRIITAHGEGRYTLEILEDRARAESSRAMAVQRVAELDQRIEAAQAEVETLQEAVDDAAQEQSLAIALHQQQLADDGESDVDLAAYAVAVMESAANRDRKRIEIGQMQAGRLALQTRMDRIDALPPLRQVDAWCADYTDDLSGEVATAEVPGEVGQVIIKPGYNDAASWSPTADGAIQPALSSTPAGVFYNLAMMPGWQKWRPTFRIATISNIASDTADISLIPAASSQQGLNVNMASAYDGVPIMYMDCNGAAFEDGDRVLVAFSGDASNPVVVGFEQEPKPCSVNYILIRTQVYIRARNFYAESRTTEGVWPPKPEGGYDRDVAASHPRPEVMRGVFDINGSQVKIFGYSRPEQVDLIKDMSHQETLSYLNRFDVLENRFNTSGEHTNRVGSSEALYEIDVAGMTHPIPPYGFSHAGTGFWFKDWWIEHERIAVSDEEISTTFTDRGSVEAAYFYYDDNLYTGKLWLSNQLAEYPVMRFTVNVTPENVPEYIEFPREEGDVYHFQRMIAYTHGPPDSGVMFAYVEYKKEGV